MSILCPIRILGYTSRAMQLGDFLGLFCITLIGLSTATVTFIWERIPKYCKSWRKKTTNAAAVSPVSAVCKPVVPNQKISNTNTYQLELEIEKLTEEIDRMLLTDKDIRGILYELFNTKWLLVHCLHGRLRILNLNLVLFNRVRHCPNFIFFVEQVLIIVTGIADR